MVTIPQQWTDERIEGVISNLLRIGVSCAAGVVFLGGVLYLVRHGAGQPHYMQFHGEPSQLKTLNGILLAIRAQQSRAIIQFGLLLLILTPIARVVFSMFAFLLQKDRFYFIVTLIVLAVLLFNLF